jgi:hypothetical protein
LLLLPIVTFGYIRLIEQWRGANYFLRLFELERASLVFFSAGRYGADASGVVSRANYIWQQSPFYGLGMGMRTIVDNAFLEVFWIGGLVALAIYVFIIIVPLLQGVINFKVSNEAQLLVVLSIFVITVSTGAPVLTKNKFATVFWLIVTLLFVVMELNKGTRKKPVLHYEPHRTVRGKILNAIRD